METPRTLAEANRCIRDLIALSTLPAIWLGAKPLRIAESLLAAIDATVGPRLSYIHVRDGAGERAVELAHAGGRAADAGVPAAIGPAIKAWAASHDPDEILVLPDPSGMGCLRVCVYALGFNAECGVLAAGFSEPHAPALFQRTLLNVAANQAVTACKNYVLRQQQAEAYAQAQREIAARSGVEAELREARSRLEAALTAGEMGTFVWDVVADRLYGDRNFGALFGIPLGDDNAAPLAAFLQAIHPGDRDRVMAEVRRTLETGCDYEAEYRIISGGSERWVIARGKLERDVGGRAVRFPGVLLDITDRKRAENARQEITERYERQSRLFERVASTTPDFIYVFDLQGRFLYANRRLLEVWGRPLDSVIGKTCRELGYEQWHHDMHMREIAQVIETKRPIRGEVPFTAPLTGIFGVYEYIFTPVLGPDGEVEVIAGTTRDVTERKRADEERERLLASERSARAEADAANRAKDRFLAVLSHELRTPLSPVVMTLPVIELDPDLPFKFREDLAMVRRNIDLEVKLIDDLLDVSRVTSGKLRLHMQPVRVHELLRHVVNSTRNEPGCRVHVQEELRAADDQLVADSARLQQVFWNLLRNAIKFTPEGGQVVVRTWNEQRELCVEVRDTGIGIEPHALPRIFEAFEQGETTTTRQFGGLGLGLAVAKAVVEMHGGTIAATSDGRDRGATFTVRLSTAREPRPEPHTGSPPAAAGCYTGQRKILLVEDHPDTSRTLAKLLTLSGFYVRTAVSAASALQLAATEQFDLMVSDIGLPDATGYELMEQVRARHGIEGIALSGYGMEDDLRRSREAGFVDHLVKPIDLSQLRAAIQRVTADGRGPTA